MKYLENFNNYPNDKNEIELIFKNNRNPRLTFTVYKDRYSGRITRIDNEQNIRFPFSVGQMLNRNIETWSSNNNYTINDKDYSPKKKIFGIPVEQIPQGHELRRLYPNKFK